MKRWSSALVVLAGLTLAAAPALADSTDDAVAAVAKAADCSNKKSAHRAWCAAADWAKGKPAALKPGLMVGLSIAVEADTDLAVALTDDLTVVMLQIDKDGPQLSATLKDVEAGPEITSRNLDTAEAAITDVLTGKGRKVTLPKDVKTVAAGLKGKGTRAVSKGKTGWTWTTGHSAAELRQVGKVWVVIETPDGGAAGRVVTILTDKIK